MPLNWLGARSTPVLPDRIVHAPLEMSSIQILTAAMPGNGGDQASGVQLCLIPYLKGFYNLFSSQVFFPLLFFCPSKNVAFIFG